MEGGLAGAHLGLNVQLGQFLVLGGEFSLSGTGIDGSKQDCFAAASGIGCSKEDDWLLLAMGRLGYAPGNWMVYGTAGWAVAGVTSNLLIAGLNPNFLEASEVHDGFAYGVGIEYRSAGPCSGYGVGCGSSSTLRP